MPNWITQHPQQWHFRLDIDLVAFAVDVQLHHAGFLSLTTVQKA